MKYDISITIVAFHNCDSLKKTVDSIEMFTSDSIKKIIYIVDNGNDEIAYKELVQKYKDIVYINSGGNIGFGKGHNLVSDDLNSDFHAIINPDILICEDVFRQIIEFMNKNISVGMCIPRLVDKEGNILKVYRKEITVIDMLIRMFIPFLFKKRQACHSLQDKDYANPFDVPFAQGSFLVIRTKLWKKLKGFDDRYFMYMEDADLCKRVNQISKLVYCPNTCVLHEWQKGSHKNVKLLKIHIESAIKYFAKWGIKFI